MKHKTIATTRFNNNTYKQYENYKLIHNCVGCIYGTPIKIKNKVPLESTIYVIEMNNEINKIEGIGIIRNCIRHDKHCRIYQDMDYNRYIYTGIKHLTVANITDSYNHRVISVLEQLLFKGSRHCKRAQGITELPDWILNNKYEFDFIQCFDKIFQKYVS